MKDVMQKACPNLMFDNIDSKCCKLVTTEEGWKFWKHTDPDGNTYNVQHCKKIGRKRDVFECINESERTSCRCNRS